MTLLEGRRMTFWHPVRVLVIDQHFPPALDALWPEPGRPPPALPLEHGALLQLGDLRFDGAAVRAMWGALSQQLDRAGEVAQVDWQRRRSKLWPSDAPGVVAQVAEGNPLQVALALAALAGTDADLDRWLADQPGGDAPPPGIDRASLAKTLKFRALRERLLDERAADLARGHARVLREHAPEISAELQTYLLLAAWLGGTPLPEAIAARLPSRVLRELFPHYPPPGPVRWLPPPRPSAIARAYVRQWLHGVAAPEVAARQLAQLACAQQPEQALRSALAAASPDPMLVQALQAVPRDAAFRLPWAQACVGALLYRHAEPPPLEPALAALDDAEYEAVARWLRVRLGFDRPHPIADPGAALQVLLMVDAQTLRRARSLSWADTLAAHKYWAQAFGSRASARLSRRRAIAKAVGQFLSSWLACLSTSTFDHAQFRQWFAELAGIGHGRDAARVAWRVMRQVARGAASGQEVHADAVADALVRARQAASMAGASARLGGPRGLAVAQAHALAAEHIATAQADFAAHAGIQQQRAVAWSYAAYAACRLGGERALTEALRLAATVEQIATAQPDFAAHAGIQRERARAWQLAAWAGHRWRTVDGQAGLLQAAQSLRTIATQARWSGQDDIQHEWRQVQGWLREDGLPWM